MQHYFAPKSPLLAGTDCAARIAVHPCLPSLASLGILETDDAGLRQLVHEHPKAIAMFTADHCATCEQLRPIFALFATNKAYAGSTFLHLRADQSPVAKQSLQQQHAPFFVSYDQGRLLPGDTLHTEHQLRAMLHPLHQPV